MTISKSTTNTTEQVKFNLFKVNVLFHLNAFSYSTLEVYLDPCQTSKMKYFVKIVNGFYPLTILSKSSILDV